MAKEVSILFSVPSLPSAELSMFVSVLAWGEVVGEPWDIGESAVVGGDTESRNGFFDLVGEEKGLDRPIVANFCPEKGLFVVCVEEGGGRKEEEEGGGAKL